MHKVLVNSLVDLGLHRKSVIRLTDRPDRTTAVYHGHIGAPVAQWVKRWPTNLADRVRSSLEVKSSHP